MDRNGKQKETIRHTNTDAQKIIHTMTQNYTCRKQLMTEDSDKYKVMSISSRVKCKRPT